MPCPADPPLLWSRTFSDDVDFRGAADEGGNLYWVEYDPPRSYAHPEPPAWLASADRDGHDRYRVPASIAGDAFLIAGGKVVMSHGAALTAYDASSGAVSWSIDLHSSYPAADAGVTGIADLGNGKIAFAMNDSSFASGLYVADIASGAILWSNVGQPAAAYAVAGSDGLGSVLANANSSSSYSPQGGYHTQVDVFLMDSAGRRLWNHHFVDGGGFLAWPPGPPWLGVSGAQGFSPAGDYVAGPVSAFPAVQGPDLGASFYFGTTGGAPDGLNVIRGGAIIAQAPIPGSIGQDGLALWPFVAGKAGDHLILVMQRWPSSPGLCHSSRAANAAVSRFDATSFSQCPFKFQGESGIEGVALLDGRLVLGRRTYLTSGCTQELQPVTIEAYGLPGESLAPSGWVQRGGTPGLGRRPR